jgi:oligopeptide transport system ATP-binding protein
MTQDAEVLLRVTDLVKYFPLRSNALFKKSTEVVHAVDGVSFDIKRGETLGLVGESGCGKSTTGRAIMRIYRPTSGSVVLDGIDLEKLSQEDLRKIRRRMQMIFQDPYSSLNPRMTVGDIISDPILVNNKDVPHKDVMDQVRRLLGLVKMDPSFINRYPHEFSGGQRQRIGIARALALQPELVICDEPISALDVSIQAQVVNLLTELQDMFHLTYLFIAHDLAMVRRMCDRVAVMYLGVIVEKAERDEFYRNPLHPYTQALLSAVMIPNPSLEERRERVILKGEIPSPVHPPSGCRFHTRCPIAEPRCTQIVPELREVRPGHFVACLLVDGYEQAFSS